jgi:hypothetical protein
MFHEQGHVDKVEHGEDGIQITGMLPRRLVARYSPYKAHNMKGKEIIDAELDESIS